MRYWSINSLYRSIDIRHWQTHLRGKKYVRKVGVSVCYLCVWRLFHPTDTMYSFVTLDRLCRSVGSNSSACVFALSRIFFLLLFFFRTADDVTILHYMLLFVRLNMRHNWFIPRTAVLHVLANMNRGHVQCSRQSQRETRTHRFRGAAWIFLM